MKASEYPPQLGSLTMYLYNPSVKEAPSSGTLDIGRLTSREMGARGRILAFLGSDPRHREFVTSSHSPRPLSYNIQGLYA
jgi:hypothetical protein